MRSRTNANVYRRAAPSSANNAAGGGNIAVAASPDDDRNGKDKVNKRSKFKLPPPPILNSVSTSANASTAKNEQVVTRNGHVADTEAPAALAACQTTTAAPQQQQRHTSYNNMNQGGFSNPYHTTYQPNFTQISQPYFTQISQPYKANNWYINTRNQQRKRLRIRVMLVAAATAIALVLFYFGFKHIQFHELDSSIYSTNYHQQRRHHHDHHHHIHPMTGFMESPLGFAKEQNPQMDHSQPILPKQTTTVVKNQQQKTHVDNKSHLDKPEVVTPFVPVTTLSDGRLLPLIGFGVASQSVDHKEIPAIVATLLQYASAESEGGGGIAMIDAVIDEKRETEGNGGSRSRGRGFGQPLFHQRKPARRDDFG